MVTCVDRLARSIKDLQDIVYALNQQGITLRATEQPVDTRSAAGKAFLDMLGVFAKFETRPRAAHRSDHGQPRILPPSELEHYCELIAALKLLTTNKSGHHLSTGRSIQLLEENGVETAQGLIKSPKGLLRKQTVNRWLSRWRLDQPRLLREPPDVRFQAESSNDCWQFDMSPSDLKHIERPDWVDPTRGEPTLMLLSVVDDRSGVAYQEYRCVYGEDAESALRFIFNAMAPLWTDAVY
ncbi:MAG: rlgA [Proteobacteria bacterium]|nr:rlgA [Pseudomonadota bacterium]